MSALNNYISIKTSSPLTRRFMYVDHRKYYADQLFIQHQVRVNFNRREFARSESDYVIVDCTVRKKDVPRFLEALKDLYDKMLVMGQTDYSQYCQDHFQALFPDETNTEGN